MRSSLPKPYRGGIAVTAAGQPLADHIGVDHLCKVLGGSCLNLEQLFIADIENIAQIHDQHNADRRIHQWQRDARDHLHRTRAVDYRSLVQAGIDPGQRSQIDDRAPAAALPNVAEDHKPVEVFRLSEIIDGFGAGIKRLPDPIDHSAVRRKDLLHHRRHDDPRYEMRHIGDRLNYALEPRALQ